MRKARLLLRLGRSLRRQAEALENASSQVARSMDRKAAASLTRMARYAARMREDARDAAYDALREPVDTVRVGAGEGPPLYLS